MLNKFEREFEAEEALATRLQILADGYRTRTLICTIAVLACFFYAIETQNSRNGGLASIIAVLFIMGAVWSANRSDGYAKDVIEHAEYARRLRYGATPLCNEPIGAKHESAYDAEGENISKY